MVNWRTSDLGTGGAGNRVVSVPVVVSRLPRRPKPANDNPQPLATLVVQWLVLLMVLAGAAFLVWPKI